MGMLCDKVDKYFEVKTYESFSFFNGNVFLTLSFKQDAFIFRENTIFTYSPYQQLRENFCSIYGQKLKQSLLSSGNICGLSALGLRISM